MAADYKVEAELELKNARKTKDRAKSISKQFEKMSRSLERIGASAGASFSRLGSTMGRLGSSMRRANRSSGSMVRNLVAIGATYVGIRLVSSAFQGLTMSMIRSNQSVEDTTLSIASLYAEIERTSSFGEATRAASGLYRQMELLAISSPGTAANIADAFSMAFGPMRRAGTEMETLLTFSRDAVAVASALRIDLPQVARDISMMATGVAGTDVRTFRMLRSMGMITETTEEWNQLAQRTPNVIATRMVDIFDRLGRQSAEAFGQTWTGLTSAFEDITGFFARAFSGPAFRVLRRELGRINDFLLKYRAGISKILTAWGGRLAAVLNRVARTLAMMFARLNDNLEAAGATFDRIVASFNRLRPLFRSMLIGAVALKVAAAGIGVAFSIAGAVFSAVGPLVGALVPLLGSGGLATLLGGGAAAGTAAAGTAAAGGAAATGGLGAIVALFAPLAVLPAVLFALPGIILGIGGAVSAVAGIFLALSRNGRRLMDYLRGTGSLFMEAARNFWTALNGLWIAVAPILQTVGFILAGLFITGLRAAAVVLVWLSRIASVTGAALAVLSSVLAPITLQIRLVFNQMFTSLRNFITVIDQFTRWLPGTIGLSTPSLNVAPGGSGAEAAIRRMIADFRHAMQPTSQASVEGGTGTAPSARPTTNVDMRGATINVRQEFREADPDRVWIQMRDALEREAVQRSTSGFVPALTR